ncbi:spindle assembly checkpoint kinase-like [Salarias fasciatus]|uniref:Spindle assembly checkpoint kinase-like n=1 Tax=Salarias fasciatus TaxID=181472 RepID=A0A672FKI5_SALFA|nr:spindle assembly checkpoint kinase-like [Salarias fasciatus]
MAHSTSTLAQGCFGKVYKQKYNDTWAAIKKVPCQNIDRKDLERECAVYNKSKHPNIVRLLGDITREDGKWVIPLEFVFGEDLETTIFKASRSKIQMTPANKGTIIVGMCEGLLYLHSKDIVHQDLKPDNIMVEHGTNRAVIIDLGLAKFFKYGLNSAWDMGNEAYAAPEVLQRRAQRDQRSDVWAMGKIIAEFCARIRLVTPSVCPTKIKETLKDQPYCQAVCRMVHPDPTLRASMGGIIDDIRVAGGKSSAVQKDRLKIPSPNIDVRNRSPSPVHRGASPFRRDPSPFRRDHSPLNRPTPPINRSPSPLNFERTPRPAVKHSPLAGLLPSPSPNRAQNDNKAQHLAPKGGSDLTKDFIKMALFQEAAKDLPCDLPATGRVMVRRFEQKNGDIETWEQKEVVTRDGQIVKFDDIKFNSK